MSIETSSASAEFHYDFTTRFDYILAKHFVATQIAATRFKCKEKVTNLIFESRWSWLSNEIDNFIDLIAKESADTDQDLLVSLLEERNFIKSLFPKAFIELDPEFVEYSNTVYDNLDIWSSKHRFIYTKDCIVDELEDYFLNIHNEFTSKVWSVIISEDKVILPNSDIMFGITPSLEQMKILDSALSGQENDIDFYEIINTVLGIDSSKVDILSTIAECFTYECWIWQPLDYVNKIASLQKYDDKILERFPDTVTSLSPDWQSHGEDLLTAAERILVK